MRVAQPFLSNDGVELAVPLSVVPTARLSLPYINPKRIFPGINSTPAPNMVCPENVNDE